MNEIIYPELGISQISRHSFETGIIKDIKDDINNIFFVLSEIPPDTIELCVNLLPSIISDTVSGIARILKPSGNNGRSLWSVYSQFKISTARARRTGDPINFYRWNNRYYFSVDPVEKFIDDELKPTIDRMKEGYTYFQ